MRKRREYKQLTEDEFNLLKEMLGKYPMTDIHKITHRSMSLLQRVKNHDSFEQLREEGKQTKAVMEPESLPLELDMERTDLERVIIHLRMALGYLENDDRR